MGDWKWGQNVCLMFFVVVVFVVCLFVVVVVFLLFLNFIGGLAVLGWDGVGDLL